MTFSIKFIICLILAFSLYTAVNADNIPSPPPLPDDSPALQHYLRSIYDNLHRLPVTTTSPNGSRRGKKGDMVLLQTGGIHYLEVNTDSSTSWSGVQLSITP